MFDSRLVSVLFSIYTLDFIEITLHGFIPKFQKAILVSTTTLYDHVLNFSRSLFS